MCRGSIFFHWLWRGGLLFVSCHFSNVIFTVLLGVNLNKMISTDVDYVNFFDKKCEISWVSDVVMQIFSTAGRSSRLKNKIQTAIDVRIENTWYLKMTRLSWKKCLQKRCNFYILWSDVQSGGMRIWVYFAWLLVSNDVILHLQPVRSY